MHKTIVTCPLCGHADFTPVLLTHDHMLTKEAFTIEKCSSCELQFTQGIPDYNELDKYYKSEEYISHSATNKGLINKLYHVVKRWNLKAKFNLISSHTHGFNLIDYGCGTGDFLSFSASKGWHCQGYEPNKDARNLANRNLLIKVDSLEDIAAYPDGQADVITLWHVLEHIHNFQDVLHTLLQKLNDKGLLVIAVPNCTSYDANYYKEYWAAYDVPRHLFHFEPKVMHHILSNLGLHKIKIAPMFFDAFYVSMLSEKYKNNGKLSIFGLFRAIFIGIISNQSSFKKYHYSSQIYIYSK